MHISYRGSLKRVRDDGGGVREKAEVGDHPCVEGRGVMGNERVRHAKDASLGESS